ncbi:MAG: tRNA (cytidine(34)-2'-O)-methyltransferase [Gammaproteobacteria bacterium]|nr:tRNA (cytidine(34)-2'-O)-methyltransferase [Gammaproteobacteria bacterium]
MTTLLNIVLYEPEIPPNTGNVIRLAANIGASLHLIHPLGFELSEKALRRAGLDYHHLVRVQEHRDYSSFLQNARPDRLFAFSTRGSTPYTEPHYQSGDYLMFGPETRGLLEKVRNEIRPCSLLRIPMQPGNRSINLSNSVALVAYEAWRQLGFAGGL